MSLTLEELISKIQRLKDNKQSEWNDLNYILAWIKYNSNRPSKEAVGIWIKENQKEFHRMLAEDAKVQGPLSKIIERLFSWKTGKLESVEIDPYSRNA